MFQLADAVVFGLFAGLGAAIVMWLGWPWTRQRTRYWIGGVCTFLAFVVWHLALNGVLPEPASEPTGPLLRLGLTLGCAVCSGLVCAGVFGLVTDRGEPGRQIGIAAMIGGLLAGVLDWLLLSLRLA